MRWLKNRIEAIRRTPSTPRQFRKMLLRLQPSREPELGKLKDCPVYKSQELAPMLARFWNTPLRQHAGTGTPSYSKSQWPSKNRKLYTLYKAFDVAYWGLTKIVHSYYEDFVMRRTGEDGLCLYHSETYSGHGTDTTDRSNQFCQKYGSPAHSRFHKG